MENRSAFVVEGAVAFSQKDQTIFLGVLPSDRLEELTQVLSYEEKEGYQRPPNPARFRRYAEYLATEVGYVTPIILNGRGQWQFEPSTPAKPDGRSRTGKLVAKGPASVVDGQHRRGGLIEHTATTGEIVPVPFLAYEDLTLNPTEIDLFNIVNDTMQRLPRSLVRYDAVKTYAADRATRQQRNIHENTVISMNLERDSDSPFYASISISGVRDPNKPVSLEGMRRSLSGLFDGSHFAQLPVEERTRLVKSFWNAIKSLFPVEWQDQDREYKLRDLVSVASLTKVAAGVLSEAYDIDAKKLDVATMTGRLERLRDFDWHKEGSVFQGLSGMGGRATLVELLNGYLYA